MKIISIDNITKKEWSDFVYAHPHGNIFQTPEMYEVYRHTKNYEPVFVGIANNSGELVGLLLSVIQREFSGPFSIISSRCVTWGGPLIREDLDKKDKNAVLEAILREKNKIARKKAIYMQFRNLWDTSEYKQIFEKQSYEYEDHLDILIDLTKSEEELWRQMKKNRRKSIKYAKRLGLKFFEECNLLSSYEMIKYTYNRVKIPLADMSLFESAMKILEPKNMAHVFCVKENGKMLSTRIMLTYKNLIYDWYAGSNEEGYKAHANEYLVWNILLWAKNKDYKIFDFGGAGNPNKPYRPREFKLRFGGTVVNFGRYKNIYHKHLYNLAMRTLEIWKRVKA